MTIARSHNIFLILLLVAATSTLHADDAKGYLGVYTRSNSNVLDQSHGFEGVTVTRVIENSPAEEAGLKEGDIILRANDQGLTDPNQLQGIGETSAIGTPIHLKVERNKELLDMEIKPAARVTAPDAAVGEPAKKWIENRKLGFEFTTPDAETAKRLKLSPNDGLQVLRIAPKGPLPKAGLKQGDVVTAVDGEPIHSADGFFELLKSKPDAKAVKLSWITDKGDSKTKRVKLKQPVKTTKNFNLPLIYSYKRTDNTSTTSIPLLLFKRERLEGATKYQLFYFLKFERGASEELLEVTE